MSKVVKSLVLVGVGAAVGVVAYQRYAKKLVATAVQAEKKRGNENEEKEKKIKTELDKRVRAVMPAYVEALLETGGVCAVLGKCVPLQSGQATPTSLTGAVYLCPSTACNKDGTCDDPTACAIAVLYLGDGNGAEDEAAKDAATELASKASTYLPVFRSDGKGDYVFVH